MSNLTLKRFTNDQIFKYVFKNNMDALGDFITSAIDMSKEELAGIEFLDPHFLLLRQLNIGRFCGYFAALLHCKASQYYQYCCVLRLAGHQTISQTLSNV